MISAYVDKYQTLDAQIELYKALNLTKMPLRKIGHETLYTKDDFYLEDLAKKLKETNVSIHYIDIDKTYPLNEMLDLDRVFYVSKVLNNKEVIIHLPTLEDFEIEKGVFTETISFILQSFKKAKINVSFHVNYEIDSAYIAYLINTFKEIRFTFNPALCYYHDKAVSTYHRLLRNNLSYVILYDLDEHKEIALLGYGNAYIIDTLDRLIYDKYKGDIILDTNLLEYITNRKAIYGRLFKLPFFKNNKSKKAYQQIEDKLGLTINRSITFEELYLSQLSLVKRYIK